MRLDDDVQVDIERVEKFQSHVSLYLIKKGKNYKTNFQVSSNGLIVLKIRFIIPVILF